MTDSDFNDEVCTTPEAARLLGISPSTVQQLVEAGIIKAWKTKGGHRRIPLSAVHAYKASTLATAEPASSAVPAVAPKLAPVRAGQPLQVLVVEDNPMQQVVYQQHFNAWKLPMQVQYCDNGYKALLEIAAQKPDVLLSDIMMAGLDGLEMIRTLLERPELADMSIAILSSVEPDVLEQRGGIPPHVLYFGKPVEFDELRGFLRGCCAQKARNELRLPPG
ncbi:helix-turn-helix domain-containing protein [Pseudoduganella ginsengisoli]|uniref:helix-turn-helix domain-containing protein n=1 Tax=Pseudoduganella ginsengisoli TaxID=1462440 RepID=UPI0035316A79